MPELSGRSVVSSESPTITEASGWGSPPHPVAPALVEPTAGSAGYALDLRTRREPQCVQTIMIRTG